MKTYAIIMVCAVAIALSVLIGAPGVVAAEEEEEKIPEPGEVDMSKLEPAGTCAECHVEKAEELYPNTYSTVEELWEKFDPYRETVEWSWSTHYPDVTCIECHGGDMAAETQAEAHSTDAGWRGAVDEQDISTLCMGCHLQGGDASEGTNAHSWEAAEWRLSYHGQAFIEEGNLNAPMCWDCHGGHEIKTPEDLPAKSDTEEIKALCGGNLPHSDESCHAQSFVDENYRPGMSPHWIDGLGKSDVEEAKQKVVTLSQELSEKKEEVSRLKAEVEKQGAAPAAEEGKGACGPTAIALLAALPVVGYTLWRRR